MRKGWLLLILPCLLLLIVIDRPRLLSGSARSGDTLQLTEIAFDSWSTEIRTTRYNSEGDLEYILQAARQVHFLDETTQLEKPELRLYQASGEDWNIRAESGRIHPVTDNQPEGQSREQQAGSGTGIDMIELIDNVELFQNDIFGNSMMLTTSFLTMDPQRETLETDRPVLLTGDRIEQSAVGMHADLGSNTVTFFSQVRGRYEPSGAE